jgi:UDP-N-acetylmuramoyl-tripeptide--D-alanyl-D-alanine ligase
LPWGSRFVVRRGQDGALGTVELPLPGRHNVRNALAAASLAIGLGASLDDVREGLAAAKPVAGRLVTHRLAGGAVLVDDSYNANPGSLAAAIEWLATLPEAWLVLGDMRELGEDARALHAEAGRRAKAAGIARLFTLGELSAAAAEAFGEGARHFDSHDALADALADTLAGAAPTILVKGSRGSAMDRIVTALLEAEGTDAA